MIRKAWGGSGTHTGRPILEEESGFFRLKKVVFLVGGGLRCFLHNFCVHEESGFSNVVSSVAEGLLRFLHYFTCIYMVSLGHLLTTIVIGTMTLFCWWHLLWMFRVPDRK